jgi:hypothetical protein
VLYQLANYVIGPLLKLMIDELCTDSNGQAMVVATAAEKIVEQAVLDRSKGQDEVHRSEVDMRYARFLTQIKDQLQLLQQPAQGWRG